MRQVVSRLQPQRGRSSWRDYLLLGVSLALIGAAVALALLGKGLILTRLKTPHVIVGGSGSTARAGRRRPEGLD